MDSSDVPTPPVIKSEGQQLLDRLLIVRGRFAGIKARLDKVNEAIGIAPPLEDVPTASGTATTFFGGLRILADELERTADECDGSLDKLAGGF